MNALHHDYIMPNISTVVSLLEFLCIPHSGSQSIELHLIAKVCNSHHEFSFQNTSLEDTGIYTCETTVRSTTTSVDFLVERLEFSLITYGKKQLIFSFYQVLLGITAHVLSQDLSERNRDQMLSSILLRGFPPMFTCLSACHKTICSLFWRYDISS